ncbi:MAG: TonB-dependent receptor [Bacteroidota bacterium]
MRYILSFVLLIFILQMHAQEIDTLQDVNLQLITVTAFKKELLSESPLIVSGINLDSSTIYGSYNLTDMLAKIPGVSMLSTGPSISKPVIRGLYGNRVLVLLSGLKFDNQQWQEEHGLGLSDMGLAKVELIKGPMSVLYGSEAMGGVVNLIEEQKPLYKQRVIDGSVKFFSNTLGGSIQVGIKENRGNKWFRVRLGIDNNADYSDGNNQRVLNSRFDGYYLKTTFGFEKKNWSSTNNLLSSFNRFGFIFNDIYTFLKPDARWSRSLTDNPAHFVILNILSSENKITLKNNKILYVNAGIQSNERMEKEGGGAISLNMHLFTFQYLLKLEKRIDDKQKIIFSHLGSIENNTNFGARKIVPDAWMQESNLSFCYEIKIKNKALFETGVNIGQKFIKTSLTPSVNSAEKEIAPFSKFAPYYNLYAGISAHAQELFHFKFNISTGVRIPNLAELSSNGLHEGVFTYEIGSPKLKNEQMIALNLFMSYFNKYIEIHISPFYNHFFNYVYLAPTTQQWFGFPVYRYYQQEAQQYGTEASIVIHPYKGLQFSTSYSGMNSRTRDGNYTPFIPAHKISPQIAYQFVLKQLVKLNLFTSADYNFAQNRVYTNEIKTPRYYLLNAGISTSFTKKSIDYEFSCTGNNLTNSAYFDHLSRFKYFGLLNIGRNFTFMMKLKFHSKLNK